MTPRVWKGPFTKALVVEHPHPTLDGYLESLGIEVDRREVPPKDEDELIAWLQEGGHNLIYKRSQVEITERVIAECPNLFAVMLCCIGDDSVDKQAAARHGVLVTNDPISNGRSVVELVLGEMICMGRRVFDAAADTAAHKWTKSGESRYELLGKTLGVVGLGNIGKQIAQLADAFGMNIVFYDTREVATEVGETLGWTAASSMQDLFERSHCVTLHVSATDYRGRSNKELITREMLASLGTNTDVPGPRLFINYARGFVLDPKDLIGAIDAGEIDYAMVDVFPDEPKRKGGEWVNPYANCPKVYCTPHIGAATQEAQPRIAKHVAGTTRRLSHKGVVRNCVFSPKHPISVQSDESEAWVLAVVHCDRRGTKKAIDETIYDAGRSNMSSTHRDMPEYGIAYDLNVLDGPLSDEQIQGLIQRADELADDPGSIRSVRLIPIKG